MNTNENVESHII